MKTRLIFSLAFSGMFAVTSLAATPADGKTAGNATTGSSAPVEASKPSHISKVTADVVKLAQSGANEQVIQSYVKNLNSAYRLSADEIIYLHQQGVSDSVVTTMIERGAQLTDQAVASQTAAASQPQPPAATTYATAPTYTAPQPASTVTYIGTDYPYYYSYGYPYYSYSYPGYCYGYPRSYYYSWPYYEWPGVGFSFSFGGGSHYRRGGFHGGYHGGYHGGFHGGYHGHH